MAVWIWIVFHAGGVVGWDRRVYLLALGLAGVVAWLGLRPAVAVPRWLLWPACLLPGWVAFQMLPLPLPVVAVLSPARAELDRAAAPLTGSESFASLSVVPGVTMNQFLLVCGYALVFLLAWQIAAAWPGGRWLLMAAPVAVALAQAGLGMAQSGLGEEAHGTYVNRDHYAGMLEMVLPFPIGFAVHAWRGQSGNRLLSTCLSAAAAAVILAGALASLSRMGFLAPLFAILVMGIVGWKGAGWRSAVAVSILACGLSAALVLLPSDELIGRLVEAPSELGVEGRLTLWHESLAVLRAYPVFGCGLGGYESAFLPYKATVPMAADNYVHNDYLQFAIELGIAGFAIGAVLFAAVAAKTARAASRGRPAADRYLAIASLGALAAIGLHSLADFNLYVPANAMLLAWVAGVASALEGPAPPSVRRQAAASVPAARPL